MSATCETYPTSLGMGSGFMLQVCKGQVPLKLKNHGTGTLSVNHAITDLGTGN
jgi:hypothetical protein